MRPSNPPRPAGSWPERGVLLLAGPSGSGKGTVAARLLAEGVALAHVSMGDLLRSAIASARSDPGSRAAVEARLSGDLPDEAGDSSPLGWLEHCVTNGLLIPDAWTEAIIAHELGNTPALRRTRWALDGYPRTVRAAEHLLATLEELEIPVWRVVHLELSEEEATTRLAGRGRADDVVAAVRRRYAFYREQVRPAMRWLEERLGPCRVRTIEAGSGGLPPAESVEAVYRRVMAALD